jgi:hypothetical protein
LSHKSSFLFFSILFLCVFGISYYLQFWEAIADKTFQFDDTKSYLEAAENLYLRHEAHLMRPYGYPLLLGLPYLIGQQPTVYWGVFLNIVLWVSTVFLLYNIIKSITNTLWARVCTAFFALNIGNFSLVFQLLSETLFVFCLVLFAFFILKFVVEQKNSWLVYAAFILSYSALVRPIAFNLWFVFIAISAFFILKNTKNTLKSRFLTTFGILSAVLLLVIQMAMMQQKFEVFTITFIDKLTFYHYLGAAAEGLKGEGTEKQREMRGQMQDSLRDSKQYQALCELGTYDMKAQIFNNLPNLFAAWQEGYRDNINGACSIMQHQAEVAKTTTEKCKFELCFDISKVLNQVYTHFLLFLLPVTFFIFYKKIKNPVAALFVILNAITLYCIILCGVSFWQGDRFLVTLVPFALICIACLRNLYVEHKK